MWGIEGSIASAVQDAPKNLFIGLTHAAMIAPNGIKGEVVFGEHIWGGLTPEQQATVEQAITKLIITAAEAYVKKGS